MLCKFIIHIRQVDILKNGFNLKFQIKNPNKPQSNHHFPVLGSGIVGIRKAVMINTGISVRAIDWAPNIASTIQYIAIGGCKLGYSHVLDVRQSTSNSNMNGIIQIWCFNSVSQSTELSLTISHCFGSVFHLKWCPLKCLDILGILAATFGDGSVRVLAIPSPPYNNEHGN
jgi:hypothetical protein